MAGMSLRAEPKPLNYFIRLLKIISGINLHSQRLFEIFPEPKPLFPPEIKPIFPPEVKPIFPKP